MRSIEEGKLARSMGRVRAPDRKTPVRRSGNEARHRPVRTEDLELMEELRRERTIVVECSV